MSAIPHILIVDDDDDFCFILRDMLESFSFAGRSDFCNDGVEALRYLRKVNGYKEVPTPGLVLLDLNMPLQNGFEVLEIMRSDPTLSRIPVMVITASIRPEDREKSLALGAAGILTKPFRLTELEKALAAAGVTTPDGSSRSQLPSSVKI